MPKSETCEKVRIRIGYMKIREIHGLLKIELIKLSKEEIEKILKGEINACKS